MNKLCLFNEKKKAVQAKQTHLTAEQLKEAFMLSL